MSKPGYSTPKLFPLDREERNSLKKEWYVGFRYTCPIKQIRKPFQVRYNINYLSTLKDREAQGKAVVSLVANCLKEGWNPFTCSFEDYIKVKQAEQMKAQEEETKKNKDNPRYFGLNDALDWAYNKKELKNKKRTGLSSVLQFAKEAAKELGIDQMPITEMNRFYICEMLDQMKANRQLFYDTANGSQYKGKRFTPNNYNVYLMRLSALFFELDNRGVMEYNPCHKITKKPGIEFGAHRHPTEKEMEIIKEQLPKQHPELYNFYRFEYVTGMRPEEMLDVKFNMVDYLNCSINISDALYNEKGDLISKTTAYRRVPVPQFLLEWIQQRSVGHDPDCYIFSRRLKPGTHRITRMWVSILWSRAVIVGLGINVSLYSGKGSGGEAKREAGIELKAVSAGYGHSSTAMAKNVYLSKEGERLAKQIIQHAPDL